VAEATDRFGAKLQHIWPSFPKLTSSDTGALQWMEYVGG